MSLKSQLVRPWLALTLVALILITRTHSSSLNVNLPDVTLAAFFVAGLWAPSLLVFALLFAAGVAADLASFAMGVSDWCFTPAYPFLVPTYACLWYAGYVCRNTDYLKVGGAAKVVACFLLACAGAYFISSHSFYVLSGHESVSAKSAMEYWSGILKWFPSYIGWASIYSVLALAVAAVARTMSTDRTSDSLRR